MSEKDSNDFFSKINEQVEETVNKIFGEETSKKINNFATKSVKQLVDIGDQFIETMKWEDNTLIKKTSDGFKDFLKQTGLLKEEEEDDF